MRNSITYKMVLSGILISATVFLNGCAAGKTRISRTTVPIMGWSSWNNFRVHINEELICEQADAMVSSGMKDAGYRFINIDDGYFGGRDKDGNLLSHPEKFPNGMKVVADHIHSRGLKAGIYSETGADTCGSQWDNDKYGFGVGLWQHEEQDLNRMLNEWGYDFIKIDYCGGKKMNMDPQERYTELSEIVRRIRPEVVFNICRWEFPGMWVTEVADSWRISGDIRAKFDSITRIIDLNAELWPYAGPGHVNDMDMLQIGRGMTYEEDKTHFSMWCMMTSPLLAGNDLRSMSDETIEILTNKEVIAVNQDTLVYQARRMRDDGDQEIWGKPLKSVDSGQVAVALLNRSDETADIILRLDLMGLDSASKCTIRDLWEHKDLDVDSTGDMTFAVPAHGAIVLKLEGKMTRVNPFIFPLR